MKKVCVILGFTTAILSVILSVTPLFKLAVFPVLISFACGLGLLYLTKKTGNKTKVIQYILLLSIIALSLIVYKAIFVKAEVGDVEEFELLEDKSEEDAIDELEDIEIDE